MLHFLPDGLRPVVSLASWAAVAWLSLAGPRWSVDLGRDATRLCAMLVLFFWGAGAVHGNYLLWLFPFMAVALASNLWRAPDAWWVRGPLRVSGPSPS